MMYKEGETFIYKDCEFTINRVSKTEKLFHVYIIKRGEILPRVIIISINKLDAVWKAKTLINKEFDGLDIIKIKPLAKTIIPTLYI